MLFNSYEFLVFFLPVTFAGFYFLAHYRHLYATVWLTAMSIVFYGWWEINYVPLLLASITFNYFIGREIGKALAGRRRYWLIFGVVVNLVLLGYYKYFNFFVNAISHFSATEIQIATIILPLGISFFTFTQIAFLVDTYRGEVREYRFVHYVLFVTYFPHLIAGPVLHHKEMMPQFALGKTYRIRWDYVAAGFTIFTIGLAKKILIADRVAEYVAPGFLPGGSPDFFQAWGSALAYTMQLYFDFSGYSDMAIGLSLLFGVRLPLNFNSPYKAKSIIDFWRRWHMTLSRFLRDYLYFPLGGNRSGRIARYRNLMITMVLGGLWHGAGWTFLVWGALHGIYLVVNHTFSRLISRYFGFFQNSIFSWGLTFIAVVVAWVFFRAPDLSVAMIVISAMCGLNGISFPIELLNTFPWLGSLTEISFSKDGNPELFGGLLWTFIALAIALFARNSQEIIERFSLLPDGSPINNEKAILSWKPNLAWAATISIVFALCFLKLGHVSEFLYFQF